ncbi:MAG: alanine racemase [Acidobacteriota bacterium]
MTEHPHHLNTWIELSEAAYTHNLDFFRRRIPRKTELSVVVKANAYGHGLKEITALAEKHKVDSYCVHSLTEALELRRLGTTKDILIMGPVPLDELEKVVFNNFRLAVFSLKILSSLSEISQKMGRKAGIHLKLETGTYRLGINEAELPDFLKALKKAPSLVLEAAYTHFANIEDTTDHSYAYYQMALFEKMIKLIRQTGFPQIKKHAACSAAALLFPETHFDMVRIGISQYGLWPSRETFLSYKIKHTRNDIDVLQPALTWKARIGQIKKVPARHTIGYGRTFQTSRESKLAVLPIGYSDGYDRRLSNQSFVLLKGQRAPLRGRVCMNLIMVDITDIPVLKAGDEAVLIGTQGKEKVSADFLAALSGTINYEVVSRLSPHIPRLIVK